ncbi:hypothetical protein BRD19_04920 [Halobacteriales archaeon SW_7_65_23]|nr:MAG: hypothetical protein BRD19_04920 [Halobacteriales archaeon SW_7_65_23]
MGEHTTAEGAPEVEESEPNPAALSLASGAVGTLVGLKRGGVPGALAGGLVGGTTGYLVGAASREAAGPREGSEQDVSPIEIETGEGADDDFDSESDAGFDSGSETDFDSESDSEFDSESETNEDKSDDFASTQGTDNDDDET